jgi:hypothetical protein
VTAGDRNAARFFNPRRNAFTADYLGIVGRMPTICDSVNRDLRMWISFEASDSTYPWWRLVGTRHLRSSLPGRRRHKGIGVPMTFLWNSMARVCGFSHTRVRLSIST